MLEKRSMTWCEIFNCEPCKVLLLWFCSVHFRPNEKFNLLKGTLGGNRMTDVIIMCSYGFQACIVTSTLSSCYKSNSVNLDDLSSWRACIVPQDWVPVRKPTEQTSSKIWDYLNKWERRLLLIKILVVPRILGITKSVDYKNSNVSLLSSQA